MKNYLKRKDNTEKPFFPEKLLLLRKEKREEKFA